MVMLVAWEPGAAELGDSELIETPLLEVPPRSGGPRAKTGRGGVRRVILLSGDLERVGVHCRLKLGSR